MITEKSVFCLINNHDYDLRKTHNGRWIDQKCAADIISFIADCILNYARTTDNEKFSSDDIQYFDYSNDNVRLLFKKPDTKSKAAANEYDKFFQQPMKMFANAGVLKEEKVKGKNIFSILDESVLEYISMSEKNSLKFLRNYIEKVLLDSGLYNDFNDFFNKQTQESYLILKEKFVNFMIRETNIDKPTEPRRIFIKVINPLAYFRNAKGTEKGRISKHQITYDMMMYNRDNFRDICAGKPKNLTRKEYLAEHPVKINEDYYLYQSEKAKRFLHIFNDQYRNGITEHLETSRLQDKATHIHHIFPKAQYPEICYYLENLIALTPTQHLNYAHPNGHTQEINIEYQHLLLLSKADRIRENLEENKIPRQIDIIYEFPRFLHVLSVGFDEDDVETIEDMDFNSVMNAINVHYAKIL